MNKTVIIGIVFVLGIVAFLIYSSMHIANYRVEVCVAYHGQTECRTASADTRDHALRSAQNERVRIDRIRRHRDNAMRTRRADQREVVETR